MQIIHCRKNMCTGLFISISPMVCVGIVCTLLARLSTKYHRNVQLRWQHQTKFAKVCIYFGANARTLSHRRYLVTELENAGYKPTTRSTYMLCIYKRKISTTGTEIIY